MAASRTGKMGKGGSIVIPADLRRQFGLVEGAPIIAEAREDGVLIRPAVPGSIEIYTPARKAEFLLGAALDATEYAQAVEEVRAMGLDPDQIPHCKPPGV